MVVLARKIINPALSINLHAVINAGEYSIKYIHHGISIPIANKFTVTEAHVCLRNTQNSANVVGECAMTNGQASIDQLHQLHATKINIHCYSTRCSET